MEDFALAQNAGMWDSDLSTLHKALIHSKDALLKDAKQLSVEVSIFASIFWLLVFKTLCVTRP